MQTSAPSFDPEATVCAGGADGAWVALEDDRREPAPEVALELDDGDLEETPDELVGTILGSYRLLDLLGEGGMGKVYLAEHVRIGRKVAIKLLRDEYASRPDVVARFFQEARAVNQIRHENIIDITDFVEGQDGRSYLVMELLSGMDLRELLRREWPLALERVLDLFVQIASGLAAAHDAGIVHRDLKPDNVFLTHRADRREFVRLVDFGVAKLLGDAMATDVGRGCVVGTPAYMSPEQAAGGGAVDHRADVYAFGAMLYRVMTGRPPFRAKTVAEYARLHQTEAPKPPSQVSGLPAPIEPRLEACILRCLAKSPGERFQTMHELAAELVAIGHRPQAAAAEGRAPGRRGRSSLVVALAAAVLGVAGTVAFLVGSGRTDKAAAVPAFLAAEAPVKLPAGEAAGAPGTAAPAAVPTEARISFVSRPLGAAVWPVEAPDGAPLGVTPFEARFPLEERTAEFVFRLKEYADATARVSLAADGRAELELAKPALAPRRAAAGSEPGEKAPPRKVKKLDAHERLDPFATD